MKFRCSLAEIEMMLDTLVGRSGKCSSSDTWLEDLVQCSSSDTLVGRFGTMPLVRHIRLEDLVQCGSKLECMDLTSEHILTTPQY